MYLNFEFHSMRLILFLLFLFTTTLASAHQLSPEEAISRLQQSSSSPRKSASAKFLSDKLSLAFTKTEGNTPLMYVMNRNDGEGFLILGADDNAPALIGYTDRGSYDPDNLPENFSAWMEDCSRAISAAIQRGTPMQKALVSHAAIEPLVQTEWDQLTPYNLLCTDRGSNFGVYTGCVATAMAQVINYHKYPVHGYGEHTYQFPKDKKTYTGSSNFAEHTYDWDHMLNTYASYNNPEAAANAVATLMHDCGVAVDMNYNTTSSGEGSGASHNLVAYALITYFGYDRSIRNVTRCYYSDEEWETMMLAELEAGRPVVYSGASTKNGGHEFVLDGYDGNGCYHFNWGWSGLCNGFFLLSGTNAINPYTGNSNYGSWGEDTGYAFNIGQAATIGIQPDKGTKDAYVGMGLPGGYTLNMTTSGYRGYYNYVNGYLWNTGVLPQTVTMGLKYVNVDNPNEVYYDASPSTMTRDLESYALSYYVYMQNIVSPGTYYAYPAFKDASDPHAPWQDVQLPYGYTDVPTFTWTGSQLPVSMPEKAILLNGDNVSTDYHITTDNAKVRCKIKAYSNVSREFYLQLFARGSSTELKRMDEIYFTMSSGEIKDFEISLDKLLEGRDPGDYTLKIRTWSESTIYPKYNSQIDFTLVDKNLGDLDGDGFVTIVDLCLLINLLNTPDAAYNSAADLDGNGVLNTQDVQLLAEKILQ